MSEGKKLDETEIALMRILGNHKGEDQAIPGSNLAELTGLKMRKMRRIINHLVIDHYISIGSHAGSGGGYYLIKTAQEAQEFERTFRQRAMTALTRLSRIRKTSPLPRAVQLTIGAIMDGKKVPGAGEAVSELINLFRNNPEQYAREIAMLKTEAAPLLISGNRMAEINKHARILAELTASPGKG